MEINAVHEPKKAKYDGLIFNSDKTLSNFRKKLFFEWNPDMSKPEEAVKFAITEQHAEVDWNEVFQSLVELHCATPFEFDWRSRALNKVIDMFTEDALPDAMAIMNAEMNGSNYPFPTVQLGQAGGVKFVHKNKLFKLIGRKTITEIYGGNNVAAMKVPQREISSINYLLSLNKPGLHLPLTVIVSYSCFAVVVSALIPIDKTTIVYGSNDGGSTVHDDSEPFRQMMEEIGTLLNLKKHEIKSSGKWLYTAGDVEGHVGRDHRNYLIDVARLSPSMVPMSDSQEWLFKQFKHQFVAVWPVALSADAFSKFENLNCQSMVEASQIEIEQATKHLINVVVPRLATELDNDETLSDFNAIKRKFEQTGVNLRFINIVFKHIQHNKRVKYHLLLNMAARALKSDILHILQAHDKQSYMRPLVEIEKLIKNEYKLDIDIWRELSSLANADLSVNQDLIRTVAKLSGITLVINESKQVCIEGIQPIVRKISPPTPLSIEQLENLVKDYERNYPTAQILIEIKERLADAYIAAGKFDKALEVNEQVLKHQRVNLGEMHTRTLATLHHIASIYHSQGNYEKARYQYEELLDVVDKNLKSSHVHRLVVMSNLALIYSDQGQYDLALKTYEEAMNYYTQNQVQHPIILTITNNLAVVHDNLGHYEEALKLHEETYNNHLNLFGETPGLVSTINNIGYIYSKQKKLEEAKKYYENAYELSCRLLGPKNIISLTGKNNIATIFNKMENYAEALKYYEEVLEGETQFYGFDNPTTLITRHNIANVLKELGDPDEALKIYKKIVAVRRRTLGEDHPDTIMTKNNIALVYYDMERDEEALKCSLAVLESCKQTFGLDKAHPITVSTMDNIANIYAKLDDDEESLKWFSLVLKFEQELYGEYSPEALVTMSKIGLAHENLGNYDEALRHYKVVYDLKKEKLGQNHYSTMMAWRDIADIYSYQRKFEEALAIYEAVLSSVEKPLDASLEDIVAYTLIHLERYAEAAEKFKEEIKLREEHLGEDHADTLDSMTGLAIAYRKQQQYDDAISVLKIVLARQKRSKESDMEDIMENKNQLALTYFKKGSLKEALKLYKQVLNYRQASGAEPADIQKTKEKIEEIKAKLDKGKTEQQ